MSDYLTLINGKYQAPTAAQLEAATAFVARWAKAWDKPDPSGELFKNLMHSDTQNKIPPMTEPADRDGVIAHFSAVLQRLPDLRIKVIRWAPTGDTVIIEWLASATVAGRVLNWTGTDRIRLRGDCGYEAVVYWDTRQLEQRVAAAMGMAKDS